MTALREDETTGTPPTSTPRALARWRKLTPRQARFVRGITAAVVMVAVAVVMVVRFASEPSLLTLGLYGIALILSGTAIVLSRRGRTRLAMAVLACGIAVVILAEPLLGSGS